MDKDSLFTHHLTFPFQWSWRKGAKEWGDYLKVKSYLWSFVWCLTNVNSSFRSLKGSLSISGGVKSLDMKIPVKEDKKVFGRSWNFNQEHAVQQEDMNRSGRKQMQRENRQARRTEWTKKSKKGLNRYSEEKRRDGTRATEKVWPSHDTLLYLDNEHSDTALCRSKTQNDTETVEFTLAVTCPAHNCVLDWLDMRLYLMIQKECHLSSLFFLLAYSSLPWHDLSKLTIIWR